MKNIRLKYSGRVKRVARAVDKANEILECQEFYDLIRAYKNFDNSALSPEVIARLMQDSGHQIHVKVHAFLPILPSQHDKIFVSIWDFGRSVGANVNMLIYETVNCMDSLYDILNTEAAQRTSGNHTAPWVIGAIAEVMAE
jgi:hypothetical protein